MPLDPEISLHVVQPATQNPFAIISPLLEMQQRINANRQFQAEYNARQKVGQIVSQAPDLETGLGLAAQDPGVAAFGGKALGELRAMQQTMVGTKGMEMEQNQHALGAAVKAASAAALTDPSNFSSVLNSQLATLPPDIRARSAPAIASYVQSLTDGNPSPGQFRSRSVGSLLGAGMSPEAVQAMTGKQEILNLGNRQIAGVQAPGFLGGGFSQGSAPLATGIAPSWQNVNGAILGAGALGPMTGAPAFNGGWPSAQGGGGGSAAPTASGGGLGQASPQPAQTPAKPKGKGGGPSAPSAPVQAFGPNPLLGGLSMDTNGTLHNVPANISAPTASAPAGLGGVQAISKGDQARIDGQLSEFNGPGLQRYNNAQNAQSQLNIIDASLDELAKAGGLATPGTLGAARNSLGKMINTFQAITGNAPSFDPASIAAGEDLQKQTYTLAGQLAHQYAGQGHVAAETINKSLQSIPGIENTYLGAKLLTDGIRASNQREIDFRNFQNNWLSDPKRSGKNADLGNSETAFNAVRPPDYYTGQVLAKYGLGKNGFEKPENVGRLVQQGLISPDTAKSILQSQFGFK